MPVLSDASVTALDIIKRSLKVRKVLSPNETPSDEDLSDAMVALNGMLKTWSAQRWMVHQILQEQFDLVINDGSYTIGPGGNFDTDRPTRLLEGSFTRLSNADSELRILEREQYDRITDKTTPGVPYGVFYDPDIPLGIIKLHFTPEISTRDLFLNSLKPLERFSSLTGQVTLPPEYEELLVYSLAPRLSEFGGTWTQEAEQIRAECVATVFTVNVKRYDDSYFQPGCR